MSLVIRTKIVAPSLPIYAVERPRPLRLLKESVERHRVTVLRAPAGFGKSTLCAQFLATRTSPSLWLSFDPFDNLGLTVRHLSAAVEDIDPEVKPFLHEVEFLAWLSRCRDGQLLVLDDFHLLADEEVVRFVNGIARRAPNNARLVISTRSEWPISPGDWSPESMVELKESHLRFDFEETSKLVRNIVPNNSATLNLKELWRQTEGWPAAVLILAQGLKKDGSHQNVTHSDSLSSLMDRLLHELLASYSTKEQELLLTMSLFDRFNSQLCAHMGSESIPRDWPGSWFLVELKGQPGWYRFHHLLAEFLRNKVRQSWSPDRLERLHQQASRWLEERGNIDEAISHALMGQEWSRAGRLIKDGKSLAELLNFYRRSAEWFQALPPREIDKTLSSRMGVVLWSALRFPEAYQAFEKGLGSNLEEVEFLCLAGLTSCCDAMGLIQKLRSWYLRAIDKVPRSPSHSRTLGLYILATLASVRFGDVHMAEDFIDGGEALQTLPDCEFPLFFGGIPGQLAFLRGDLEKAVRVLGLFQKRCARDGHKSLERIAWGLMASVHYEMGKLGEAQACWDRHLEGDPLPHIVAFKAQLWPSYIGTLSSLGRVEKVERALRDPAKFGLDSCPAVETVHLRWLLQNKRLGEASALMGEPPRKLDENCYRYAEQPRYWAWILLWANSDERAAHTRAHRWLTLLEKMAKKAGRARDPLETRLTRAALFLKVGQDKEAEAEVQEALHQGRPLGYVAVFIDSPVEVRRLCLRLDPTLPRAASQWRQTFSLSPREREVLELLRSGISNQQIAERCFLSLHTVKWYNRRIFKKLVLKTRAEILSLPSSLEPD